MRLKQRVGDFHVRELLNDDVIQPSGQHMVYRVTKKKLTTPEAVRILAEEAGVQTGDIAFCGLKDRQGVTTQYMSVQAKHREVQLSEQGLRIEPAGWVDEPLSSAVSRGNAFEVTVRALRGRDIHVLRQNIEAVREHGLVNYFDDQRFGNLRHEQGWVARELMRGNYEEGLKRMLFWPSPFDSDRYEKFKGDIGRNWGRWDKCAGIARGFGEHFSIFDHLHEHPDDFAGAFYHAPSRIRLIHLYAYQSHVWNRAAALLVRDAVAKDERVIIPSDEGALPSHAAEAPGALVAKTSLRLPGSHLADAGEDREVYDKVLAAEDMTADEFHIEGVPGFALKGEDRPLIITPGHLRVRPAEEDRLNRGMRSVRLRFELGRGSYATLVVKRLFESLEREQADAEEGEGFRGPRPERGFRGDRAGGPRGGREDREGGYRGGRGGGFQRGGDDRQRGGYRDRRGHRRDEGELQRGEGYRRERAERPERGRGEDGRGFRRERGDGGGGFRRDGGPRREGGGRGGWGGGRGGDRRDGGRGYGRSGDGGRGGEGGERGPRREGGYRREGARNEGGGYGGGRREGGGYGGRREGGGYGRGGERREGGYGRGGGQGGGRYQRDDRGGRGRYSRDDRGGEGGFKREGGGRSFNKGGKRFDREGGGRRFDKDDKQRERPTPPKDGESPWGSGGGDAS